MKKIIEYLNANAIENRVEKWGDNYFNDNFNVSGLLVSFDCWIDPEAYKKEVVFLSYMKRKKAYDVYKIRGGCISSYRILTVFDAKRLEKHEREKRAAVEAFWEAEHARRINVNYDLKKGAC